MKTIHTTALLLILSCAWAHGQTFMIVATEVRDGEELNRPFASQEGMIEGMFDLGFVSFDTGLYAPEVDWAALDFKEPLAIARQGLARYLLAAEVRCTTEPRDPEAPVDEEEEPPLKIRTSVRYYLFDVTITSPVAEGHLVADNESAEEMELTYREFLHSVGQDIAARGVALMRRINANT